MATRKQAEKRLADLGLCLAPDGGKMPNGGHDVTIDAVGRMSFNGECRGHVVFDYTIPAADFWDEVIERAEEVAQYLQPCPHAEGECEFHD